VGVRAFAEGFARLSETRANGIFGLRLGIQTNTDAGAASRRGLQ